MKTLHLNIKKKWFDMILSGEKKEEYKEIKTFWIKRLLNKNWQRWYSFSVQNCKNFNNKYIKGRYVGVECSAYKIDLHPNQKHEKCNLQCDKFSIEESDIYKKVGFADFGTVTFRNAKSQFVIELLSISLDFGKPERGAENGKRFFVLKLGDIISSNCS